MQAGNLPVCTIDLFDEKSKHFWISSLDGLLFKYPFLENPHTHNFYALFFIEDAQGEISIDQEKIVLNDAKVIISKPRCINSIDINSRAKGKIVFFDEEFFSLRYNNNNLYQFTFLNREGKSSVRITEQQSERLMLFLNLLQDEFLLQKSETKKVLRSYLNILLFELERMFGTTSVSKNQNPKQDKIQQFEKLIDKYFIEKKLPSSYADLLNVSPNYLNKICKEVTGNTAGDLIRKRVVIEAQRLIHYTHYSINEIADKLGFENVSYFVTFFKKQTNITPEQYRKVEK